MADLPMCPQFRERGCERSEIRLSSETEKHWIFLCKCCSLTWVVSKPKAVDAARYQNAIQAIQRATEAERANAHRKYFFCRPSAA